MRHFVGCCPQKNENRPEDKKRTKRIEENPAILPNPLNNNLLRLYSGGVAI